MADGSRASEGYRSRLDFPSLAQEFLRRNPAYRRDYECAMSDPLGHPPAQEVTALRWGLRFPGRSVPARD
jgi:hypothetical protein